jgi:hypothetical protein
VTPKGALMAKLDSPVLPPLLYRYRKLASEDDDDRDSRKAEELFVRELNSIKNRLLHFSNYKAMNDPMEGFYDPSRRAAKDPKFSDAASAIYHAKLGFGLCCLSDTHNNELMWSHYSNNYFGICVAHQPRPLLRGLPKGFHLIRVAYGNEPPPLSIHDFPNDGAAARKILSHKKASWAYEREWRLLGPLGLHRIKSKTCVRELYLGLRIQQKYRERLLNALRNVSIRIFAMKVADYNHEWELIKDLK